MNRWDLAGEPRPDNCLPELWLEPGWYVWLSFTGVTAQFADSLSDSAAVESLDSLSWFRRDSLLVAPIRPLCLEDVACQAEECVQRF